VGCGKHFPGLGGGTRDSHLETPAIERGWKEIWELDLGPYRELVNALPVVMVTHAAYPQTRSGNVPATASAYWATTVLQRRLGFRGLIFSDDMEMGGILKFMAMEEAAVAALRAGLHMLEICHSPELILGCYESLIHEAERSVAFRRLLLDRAAVASRMRKRFADPGRALAAGQLNALRERVLRFAATVEVVNADRAEMGRS